jgi:hypothetical protein
MENKILCICKKTAKRFCDECKVYLCNECTLDNHSQHVNKVFKINSLYSTNIITFLHDIFDIDKPIMEYKCDCNQDAHFLCKSCRSFICDKCLQEHAKSHPTMSINEYFDSIKRRIGIFQNILKGKLLDDKLIERHGLTLLVNDKLEGVEKVYGQTIDKLNEQRIAVIKEFMTATEGKEGLIKVYKDKIVNIKAIYGNELREGSKCFEYLNEYESLVTKFINEHDVEILRNLFERLEYIHEVYERLHDYVEQTKEKISLNISQLGDNITHIQREFERNKNKTDNLCTPEIQCDKQPETSNQPMVSTDTLTSNTSDSLETLVKQTSSQSNLININTDKVIINDSLLDDINNRSKSNTEISQISVINESDDLFSRRQTSGDNFARLSCDSNTPMFAQKLDLIKMKIKDIKEPDDSRYNKQIKELLSILNWDERDILELSYLGYNCNTVFVYNTFLRKVDEIEIDFKFPSFHSFVNRQPYIYISGGRDSTNQDLTKLYRLKRTSEKAFEITELAPMNTPRSYHVMVPYSTNKLIAISGSKVKSCEIYDIDTNKWENLPDLISSRERPTAYIHENVLYVFSGFDKLINKFLNTIERLDLNNPVKWEAVSYGGNQNCLKRFSSCCYCHNSNLYILGGVNSVRNLSKEVLIYNLKTNSVSVHKTTLDKAHSFNQVNMVNLNSQIVNLSEEFDIVKLDLTKFI